MKRYDAGIQGEQEAENALTRQGMTLRTRRYRAEDGEIDLVMQDGETIVFVEVKARPQSRAGQGMLAVTPAKQRRICHTATTCWKTTAWMFPRASTWWKSPATG